MRSSKLFNTLQNLIGFKPSYEQIGKIIGIRGSAVGNRVARDAHFVEEELVLLEDHFGIELIGGCNSNNFAELNYYTDVFASCGTGAVVFEETSEKLSVPTSLIKNYSKSNQYSVINARGDSMQPFLQDRDKLIVEHYHGEQIIDNCIYVFRYANELFVKRLVKNITQIVIKSDNPLYEPIKITDKDQDFEIIGQIVGLMRDLR